MKQKFFDLAKRVSKLSDHPQHRHGTVIVRKNKIISVGCNKNKTHTQSNHKWKRLHSEIAALLGLDYDVTKHCVAYVYRETKQGEPAMSKPCEACETALRMSGIKTVYYSVPGGWISENYVA